MVSHASISFLAGLLQEGKFLKYYLKKIRQKENRQTNQLREGGRGQVTCVRQTPVCLEVLLNKTRQTTTTGTQRRRQSSCSELTARQQVKPVHQSLLHTRAHALFILHPHRQIKTCRYRVHSPGRDAAMSADRAPPPPKQTPQQSALSTTH